VRVKSPFVAFEFSEPEPDVAVVPVRSYVTAHPADAYLLVEVNDSSSAKDSQLKARIYAEAGVPEYRIVDVFTRTVMACTEPTPNGYAQRTLRGPDGEVAPARFPNARLRIAELLE